MENCYRATSTKSLLTGIDCSISDPQLDLVYNDVRVLPGIRAAIKCIHSFLDGFQFLPDEFHGYITFPQVGLGTL